MLNWSVVHTVFWLASVMSRKWWQTELSPMKSRCLICKNRHSNRLWELITPKPHKCKIPTLICSNYCNSFGLLLLSLFPPPPLLIMQYPLTPLLPNTDSMHATTGSCFHAHFLWFWQIRIASSSLKIKAFAYIFLLSYSPKFPKSHSIFLSFTSVFISRYNSLQRQSEWTASKCVKLNHATSHI